MRFVYRTVALIALIIGSLAITPMLAQAVNVTGDWAFEVQTDQGSGTATVTFKQEGEKLTGKIPQLGAVDLTGTVKGNAIHFTFTRDIQGQSALVTYDGTVEKTEMKGTMNIAGVVNGTFTGKKKLE
jgi:hypothetical protein